MVTKVEFPDFEHIVLECKDLITAHYEQYKNSWKNIYAKAWWVSRIYKKAQQVEFTETEKDEIDKLEDLINIVCMRLDHLRTSRDKVEPK